MVPSRCVKSEYMKRFKEPKWEACGPCYQELLRYRLSRRILEQAHRPWFWDGWEQGSSLSSGSAGSSSPPGTSSPEAAQPREQEAAVTPGKAEAPGEPGLDPIGASAVAPVDSPAGPLRVTDEEDQDKVEADPGERKLAVKAPDKTTSQTQQLPSNRGVSGSRGDRRQLKSPQRTDTTKEIRHPFALYGWGEKQTDTGSQKTHNVCASASENENNFSKLIALRNLCGHHLLTSCNSARSSAAVEGTLEARKCGLSHNQRAGESIIFIKQQAVSIQCPKTESVEFRNGTKNWCADGSIMTGSWKELIHESALRAKNRRQVEKRRLFQRQVHPTEVERTWRAKPSGPDNPWMTEYMRCYSARAR